MSKATAICVLFLGAFALVLGTLASLRVAAGEPRYRLDARYHNLPSKLVADLLAHPPERRRGPRVQCMKATFDGEEIGYCICFGADACDEAPRFNSGHPAWECIGPLGFLGDQAIGVCRAEHVPRVIITG